MVTVTVGVDCGLSDDCCWSGDGEKGRSMSGEVKSEDVRGDDVMCDDGSICSIYTWRKGTVNLLVIPSFPASQ